jgi:DNA-binding response OmpR family regulator
MPLDLSISATFRCESDLHVRVLASGAFYLLRKPFEASALIACLTSAMAG